MSNIKKKYENIVLLGFRYTGKSTTGRVISELKNWDFFDLDKEIELETKSKIFDLVKTNEGWHKFRETEFEIFNELIKKQNSVISCGSGFCINNAMSKNGKTFGELERDLIRKSEKSFKIMLEINQASLIRRIRLDSTKRPLLSNNTNSNLDDIINENISLQNDRKETYDNINYNIKIDSSDDNFVEKVKNGTIDIFNF